MKKIILITLLLFLAQILNAQINVKNNFYKYPDKNVFSVQNLNTNVIGEYGLKDLKFMKQQNGKYIPVRFEDIGKNTDVQISQDVITIFAIIGGVVVAIILLRVLLR